MGNWSLPGTLLLIGAFFAIFAFILSQIHVTNPYTGTETSIIALIIDWMIP